MTTTISNKPNYQLIKKLVENILLSVEHPVLPIKVMPIVNALTERNMVVQTYDQYVKSRNLDYDSFLSEAPSKEGTLGYSPDSDSYVLLYNKNVQKERKAWTIAHELGHYYAQHLVKKHNYLLDNPDISEVPELMNIVFEKEANFFAREFLAPTSLVQISMVLLRVSDFVSIYTILRSIFRLSQEASYNTATDIHKYRYPDYSKKLCFKYAPAMDYFFNTIIDHHTFNALLRKYQGEIDARDRKRRMSLNPGYTISNYYE
jgi:Zn-dependent peptidase ImmA (M78 family)